MSHNLNMRSLVHSANIEYLDVISHRPQASLSRHVLVCSRNLSKGFAFVLHHFFHVPMDNMRLRRRWHLYPHTSNITPHFMGPIWHSPIFFDNEELSKSSSSDDLDVLPRSRSAMFNHEAGRKGLGESRLSNRHGPHLTPFHPFFPLHNAHARTGLRLITLVCTVDLTQVIYITEPIPILRVTNPRCSCSITVSSKIAALVLTFILHYRPLRNEVGLKFGLGRDWVLFS